MLPAKAEATKVYDIFNGHQKIGRVPAISPGAALAIARDIFGPDKARAAIKGNQDRMEPMFESPVPSWANEQRAVGGSQ